MNCKKIWFCLLLLSVSFLSLAIPAQEFLSAKNITINSPPDIQRILDRGFLKVAMYHKDTPPFYYQDENGRLTGVDAELIRGFARLLKVRVVFDRSAKTFNQVVDQVASREVDLAICKLSITFPRAKRVLFTSPYISLHQGLLVNRLLLANQQNGRAKEETLQNLTGKIGVIGNSSYVGYARQRFPNMQVVEYPSWEEVISAVLNEKVVAAYRDEAEIKRIIRDNPDTSVKLLTVVLKDAKDLKGIAVAWDAMPLKSLLEIYVDSLGLELTANSALFNYNKIVENIHRGSH